MNLFHKVKREYANLNRGYLFLRATAKGDAEAASKFNAQAREETLKLNQDETRLRQATLGKAGGVASESISATMMNKTARAGS